MKSSVGMFRVVAVAVSVAAWPCASRSADPAQPSAAPSFQTLRFEDSQATRKQGLIYMKLGWNDASDLSVGGQVRLRGEWWENFNFREDNDDEFLLTRIRLHGDLRACPNFRLFVEGRSAIATDRDLPTPDGSGKRPGDEDVIDLLNAFGDVSLALCGDASAVVRGGRQEMLYGRQRVIGPGDWNNTRRSFDGAKLMLHRGDWTLDGFATRLVQVQRYEFNDGDSGQDFYGVYGAGKLGETGAKLDAYWLLRNKDGAGAAPDDERQTAGSRLSGNCGTSGVDYDVEGMYQFGDQGDADIGAWALAAEIGYKVPECPYGSRLFAGYDYATGDEDAADGDAERYDQLYPTGHMHFGLVDVIGRINIQDFSAGITAEPAKKIKTKVEGHWFERAEDTDGVFDASGNQVIAGDASDASEIGQEIDFSIGYQFDPRLLIAAGYGHFFAGDVVDDAAGDDIDTAYLTGQYTF